jgi:hypothetical protein
MERKWAYEEFQIKEGLKPGSKHFQYFFVVSKGAEKKCSFCVWIDDETLSIFSQSKAFEEIASSQREDWTRWVQGKIDQGDFRNLVLKFEKTGRKEIDLSEMTEKIEFE